MSDEAELPLVRRSGKSEAAFRTISEVADELDVPQHVLRFWESKFPQVKPLKRGGGRRYYRPEDVALLKRIRDLLYSEGYTIKGVQKLLREGGHKDTAALASQGAAAAEEPELALDDEDESSELPLMDDGEEGGEELIEEPEEELAPFEPPAPVAPVAPVQEAAPLPPDLRAELKIILGELEQLRSLLAPR